MVLVCENFLNTCLSDRFIGIDSGCASGVVLRNDSYQRSHATTFHHMFVPIYSYDLNIAVFEGAHRADKQKWSANLTNQIII